MKILAAKPEGDVNTTTKGNAQPSRIDPDRNYLI